MQKNQFKIATAIAISIATNVSAQITASGSSKINTLTNEISKYVGYILALGVFFCLVAAILNYFFSENGAQGAKKYIIGAAAGLALWAFKDSLINSLISAVN